MSLFGRTTTEIGNEAEQLACQFLQKHGLKLVENNYRAACGELDLIMMENTMLVFIEVRYRKNPHHGSGAETVTKSKQRKLITTALHYLQTHPKLAKLAARFDVISVSTTRHSGNPTDIDWIQNAFQA